MNVVCFIAQEVRDALESKYPMPLYGRCVEATEIIVEKLIDSGFEAESREGWCLYEDEDYGTSHPYDEHTWCEVSIPGRTNVLVVDVTLDQFQGGFFQELPRVYVGEMPSFFQYSRPELDSDEYEDGIGTLKLLGNSRDGLG